MILEAFTLYAILGLVWMAGWWIYGMTQRVQTDNAIFIGAAAFTWPIILGLSIANWYTAWRQLKKS